MERYTEILAGDSAGQQKRPQPCVAAADVRTWSARPRAHTPHPASELHCTHTHAPTTSLCAGARAGETSHLGSNPDSAPDLGRLIHPTASLCFSLHVCEMRLQRRYSTNPLPSTVHTRQHTHSRHAPSDPLTCLFCYWFHKRCM